jgi:hypothetical protein
MAREVNIDIDGRMKMSMTMTDEGIAQLVNLALQQGKPVGEGITIEPETKHRKHKPRKSRAPWGSKTGKQKVISKGEDTEKTERFEVLENKLVKMCKAGPVGLKNARNTLFPKQGYVTQCKKLKDLLDSSDVVEKVGYSIRIKGKADAPEEESDEGDEAQVEVGHLALRGEQIQALANLFARNLGRAFTMDDLIETRVVSEEDAISFFEDFQHNEYGFQIVLDKIGNKLKRKLMATACIKDERDAVMIIAVGGNA